MFDKILKEYEDAADGANTFVCIPLSDKDAHIICNDILIPQNIHYSEYEDNGKHKIKVNAGSSIAAANLRSKIKKASQVTFADDPEQVSETIVAIPVEIVKQLATELGYVPKQDVDDTVIIAALDDYFKTLTDGQYSPLSGEHNNASNNNEVFHIAKKHGVDPAKLMQYLNDLTIFDKFSKDAATRGMVRRIPEMKKGFSKVLEEFEKRLADSYTDTGMVEANALSATREVSCPCCSGLGEMNGRVCSVCHGQKHIPAEMAVRYKAQHSTYEVGEAKGDNERTVPNRNPVAKFQGMNRAATHRDKKKDYRRSDKHKSKVSETEVDEAGMPSSVARHKQKLDMMYPEELHDYFNRLAAEKKSNPEEVARSTAWRHGHGKMSSHYWDQFKHLASGNVSEGKKMSVYQGHLINFLNDMHEEYEMRDDKIVVGQGVYNQLSENFPEFKGLIVPRDQI
jgi:hypothetical protein